MVKVSCWPRTIPSPRPLGETFVESTDARVCDQRQPGPRRRRRCVPRFDLALAARSADPAFGRRRSERRLISDDDEGGVGHEQELGLGVLEHLAAAGSSASYCSSTPSRIAAFIGSGTFVTKSSSGDPVGW
jgi:hypothetical protein